MNEIVAKCTNNKWTKWLPLIEWKKTYQGEPNYRQRHPNEAILETDYPEKETNLETMATAANILFNKKYAYQLWDSGGKGYHLHIYFSEPVSKPMIRAWTYSLFPRSLADSFDDSNWNEKRLIGIENAPHRKTGELKIMIDAFKAQNQNTYPPELKKKVEEWEATKRQTNYEPHEFNGNCAACEYALQHPFPIGIGRNIHLIPNIVAILPPEKWEQAAKAQNKNLSEFENWAKRNPGFNCLQLQSFTRKQGLHEKLCEKCPHRIIVMDQKEKIKVVAWQN